VKVALRRHDDVIMLSLRWRRLEDASAKVGHGHVTSGHVTRRRSCQVHGCRDAEESEDLSVFHRLMID